MIRNLLATLCLPGLLFSLARAEVVFVGVESGLSPEFRAQRWSLATEPKEHAVANDFFGGSGYYCLAPDQDVPVEPVTASDITAFGTILRKPDFITAHPVAANGNWVNFPGYALVTRPATCEPGDAVRIGGISTTVGATINGAGVETRFVDVFSFQLSANTQFRLGVMVDAFDGGVYAPDYISVYDNASQTAVFTSQPLTRDGIPDLVLFDIDGTEGTSYTMALHRQTPAEDAIVGFSMVTFDRLSGEDNILKVSSKIGQFERDGEYLKDYYVFKEGGTFHLFYNVGNAGQTQDWQEPGNEKAFGHATSTDLQNWQHHPRVLPVVPDSWEGNVVSAPSIIKHEGVYHMVYTGFDDRVIGKQSIGLATSTNLFDWVRHPANPVYTAPSWALPNPGGWVDCRDSDIFRHGDEFLMFTTVTTNEGRGAIALASSPDAVNWKDLGPAVVTFDQPESPRVFWRHGMYYLFVTSGLGRKLFRTADPKSNQWSEIPFEWPAPGLWSGWEVVQYAGRTIFSAFEWKLGGNYVRFWDAQWNDVVPSVVYLMTPQPPAAMPALTVSRFQNDFSLYWPLGVTDCILETSANLTGGSWSGVPETPANSLTVPMNGTGKFFRLKRIP